MRSYHGHEQDIRVAERAFGTTSILQRTKSLSKRKEKTLFNSKLRICYRTKKKKKYETTEHEIFEISCFVSV